MVRVTIDENLCKGCGLCARACPKHIIELSKTRINAKGYHPAEVINMEACIGCTSFFPNGGHENTLRLNYSCMPEDKIIEGITALCQTIRENLH